MTGQRLYKILLAAIAIAPVIPLQAQQATEVYIPIGQSPGLSATQSIIGTIEALDRDTYEMTVSVGDRSTVVVMTAKTRYYIDRNRERRQNGIGDIEDCEIGYRVEVKFNRAGMVEWVKIAERR